MDIPTTDETSGFIANPPLRERCKVQTSEPHLRAPFIMSDGAAPEMLQDTIEIDAGGTVRRDGCRASRAA
jgi:hypothetical protein